MKSRMFRADYHNRESEYFYYGPDRKVINKNVIKLANAKNDLKELREIEPSFECGDDSTIRLVWSYNKLHKMKRSKVNGKC